ncbi:MAG: AbiV family abortive infection protein [Monoglobaceae bacterium]
MIDELKSITMVEKIIKEESNFTIKSKNEFNKCIEHLFQLITAAYTLYMSEAFPSSVFLSITVIEEVAKIHMGIYAKSSDKYVKKDKLRDHETKEIIGANCTIYMSERIKKAIDTEKLETIFELAYSGKLKELREKSIYCEFKDGKIVIPHDIINKEFSKNMLLFAIESFDDNLVGYTNYSMDISKKTGILFDKVANI